MPDGYCPQCDKKVDLAEDLDIGLKISCKACHAALVVVWLNPIELMLIDSGEYGQFDGDYHMKKIPSKEKKERNMATGRSKKGTRKTTSSKKTSKK
jgi:hypothetical protein